MPERLPRPDAPGSARHRPRRHPDPRRAAVPSSRSPASLECGIGHPTGHRAPTAEGAGMYDEHRIPRSRWCALHRRPVAALRRPAHGRPPGQPPAARLPGPAPRRGGPPAGRRRSCGPTVDDGRAAGNLRSALWRLQQVGCPLVLAEQSRLAAARGRRGRPAPGRGVGRAACCPARPAPTTSPSTPGRSPSCELLPGWYDDWVLAVRERLQLRLLHALEALSRLLRRAGPAAAARRGRARRRPGRAAARERPAGPDRGPPGGRRLGRRPPPVRRLPRHPAPRDRRRAEPGADRRRHARGSAR